MHTPNYPVLCVYYTASLRTVKLISGSRSDTDRLALALRLRAEGS